MNKILTAKVQLLKCILQTDMKKNYTNVTEIKRIIDFHKVNDHFTAQYSVYLIFYLI